MVRCSNCSRACDCSRRGSAAGLLPRLLAWAALGILLLSPRTDAQTLEQSQRQFLEGKYREVIDTATRQVASRSEGEEWRVLLVNALLTVGRYADAGTNALAGLEDFPGSLQLRLLARESALYRNDAEGARRQLAELKYLIQRRSGFEQSGPNLVALGRALILLGIEPRLALENCFQRAYAFEPPVREAFLAGGQLALDKHDFSLAARTFRDGLKKFPDDPDLQAGLAQAFESSDRREMVQALEAALSVNPHHVRSLLLLADHLIDAERYEEAEKQLGEVLAVNPTQPEALAYRAALASLRHDLDAETQLRAQALQSWTNNPQVDCLIGTKLAQKYRFEEGAAAQRRALAFAPDYLPARRQLAEDLLRLGQDQEGWQLVQDVRAQDEYDVTAYNLSTLHDQLAKFRTVSNADFIVRMAPQEALLYGERVLDLLERAKTTLCSKYGVELKRPTVVEIFSNQKDFAVRTFGMPGNPGYLGVCFGSVITANSPASQLPNPANWSDVLWHEFCHVVTLTDTKNRMPRWLSEGISEYEERQADPAWGERMTLAYREMIRQGELTPLSKLSGAFLQPKSSEALQFAYYESSLVVEFLVQRFGLEALKQLLLDLREGQEVNKAIAARSLPLPELEKAFAAFVKERAENLAPGADLEKPPAEEAALVTWKAAHTNNYYLRLERAEELMEGEHWAEARPLVESLAASYHGERRAENPLWLQAVVARHLDDTNAEFAALQQLAEQESDFVDLQSRLIALACARQDWPAETKYAQRLVQINPLLAAPYRALAEAGVGSHQPAQAIEAYRKLLLLEPPDLAELHFRLARLLHTQGGAENEAKRHVLQALEDAPRYREAQQLLLEIEAAAAKNPTAAPTQS